MAKIKFGAMVNDARGSLDGVVYSKNQYGGYVRVKVSPVQPRSEKQIEARSILAAISTYYSNSLTDAQRLAWKQFAGNNPVVDVFGNSQTLTALAMFQTVNAVLKHSGVAIMADPPANMDVTAPVLVAISAAQAPLSYGPSDTTFDAATKTIYSSVDFAFTPGERFTVSGTVSNNGTYIVSSRPSDTDIIVEEALVNEDCLTTVFTGLSPKLLIELDSGISVQPALYVMATPPLPGGVSFFDPKLRLLDIGPANGRSIQSFSDIYKERFGAIKTGHKIGLLVASVNPATGAVSVGSKALLTVG